MDSTVAGGLRMVVRSDRHIGRQELDKTAVAELVNDTRDTSGPVPRPSANEIGDFTWADLGGNGSYQLVLTEDVICESNGWRPKPIEMA